jgi:hypothetical protein
VASKDLRENGGNLFMVAGALWQTRGKEHSMKRLGKSIQGLYWRLMKRYRPIKYFEHQQDLIWQAYEADIAKAKDADERRAFESLRMS